MKLRPAEQTDAHPLWLWRNDPETRANSINTEAVPWEDHCHWLKSSIANPNRELLIAEKFNQPVGTVRIDEGVELSWTVAPERRGMGYGKEMVAEVARPGHVARIKRENLASQKIAQAAGFTLAEDGEVQEWVKTTA